MRELILFALLALQGNGPAVAREPIESRARWACSAYIVKRLAVPDSVEWTRRSRWPVVEIRGVWVVRARFTSKNRMGVTIPTVMDCAMKYDAAADEWRAVEIRKAPPT